MKTIRITFEDAEYNSLLKEKLKMKAKWKMLIFCRVLKIRMKGESGKFRA
jgi:hypothetical protein